MKTKLPFFAVLCCSCIMLIACGKDEPDCILNPAPPSLIVSGCVTNTDQQPLESIHIVLDSVIYDTGYTMLDSIFIWRAEYSGETEYTNKEGKFTISYAHDYMDYGMEWPSKIILTAQDTSGIYVSGTDTFSVVMVKTYPNMKPTSFQNLMHGTVSANFVLEKTK